MNRTGRHLLITARLDVRLDSGDPIRRAGFPRGSILASGLRRPFHDAGFAWERERRVRVLRGDAGP